ncbi:MAG: NAD(P)H-dependent oxidoreductase [Clostridiales bacterium]|nr:NAD(P)H-dependent oxidoreductase [Clostridiales bacterium]
MILLINACVRKDSRTKRLTDALLKKLPGEVTEVDLGKIDFPVVDEAFLQKRDALIEKQQWDDPIFALAMQFKSADTVVVAAPYWDLSFPASLKQYFEQINAMGTTFDYSDEGLPIPLCKAEKLYYVMTAGGALVPEEFGFGYVKALAENFYGIREVKLLSAVGFDIYGADVEAILKEAEERIDDIL